MDMENLLSKKQVLKITGLRGAAPSGIRTGLAECESNHHKKDPYSPEFFEQHRKRTFSRLG